MLWPMASEGDTKEPRELLRSYLSTPLEKDTQQQMTNTMDNVSIFHFVKLFHVSFTYMYDMSY